MCAILKLTMVLYACIVKWIGFISYPKERFPSKVNFDMQTHEIYNTLGTW